MKKSINSVLIAGILSITLSFATSLARAADKDTLNDRIHSVNDAANKSGNMKTALHSISVETGVPESQVEAMHKKYSDIGVAGVLMSCVLADETKKTPEYFMDKHKGGKSWTELARESKVALDKINTRLEHVERTLSHPNSERKIRTSPKK